MKIIYGKSKWELWNDPFLPYLKRVAQDDFDATEIFIPSLSETPSEVAKAHDDHGLKLIAQIITEGDSLEDHIRCLETRYLRAIQCRPLFINCHSGTDAFTVDENLRVFSRALELEQTHGVPICHELHRGRALYNAPDTLRYLQALPTLRITADFSHWQVVHESDDLKLHTKAVDAVIKRAFHVHARVGFGEGPQIPDPSAPEWAAQVAINMGWWQRIVDARRNDGTPFLTITPEFGPVPYMPTIPHENRPVADTWAVNCWMREHLIKTLRT